MEEEKNNSYSTHAHTHTPCHIKRKNKSYTEVHDAHHESAEKLLSFHYSLPFSRTQTLAVAPAAAIRCLSFTVHDQRGPSSPRKALPSPHIMYTPSFENGSFLKIHLDYQTLKVTSLALSVWPGRGGGAVVAADSRTMRRARHQRLNGLCSRRKGRRPFVLSHIQLFLTRASFHNKREFNFNAISEKKKERERGGR